MKNFLSLDKEIEIVNLRKSGRSPKEIMCLYDIKKHHYYNIISRNGTSRSIPNKKYLQNDNYFSIIDSTEKAYWLGFLFADGYVREYQLSLCLSLKDKLHLIKFKNSIESDSEIKDRCIKRKYKGEDKIYYSSTLDIYSITICNDLLQYGLCRNKSLILQPPKNVSEFYFRDFIRGYFDGDGCVSTFKNHKKIKILGTYEFLNWINKVLSNNGVSIRNIDKQTNNIFRIQYNTKDVKLIYNYFYKQSIIHLERKKEKFS
jgi:hypothetical protein